MNTETFITTIQNRNIYLLRLFQFFLSLFRYELFPVNTKFCSVAKFCSCIAKNILYKIDTDATFDKFTFINAYV